MPDSVAYPPYASRVDHKPPSESQRPAPGESTGAGDQWQTWDEEVFEQAARRQAQMPNTPSSTRPPLMTPISEERRVSRARRPLPPIPVSSSINPAPPQQPGAGTGSAAAPARSAASKRSTSRPAGHADYSLAHSSAAPPLRRRGTLFASDVPIPDDYEAPPPFHAIAADRPAFHGSVSPGTRRGAFESPPPSPLGSSFPGASPYSSPSSYYGTAIATSRPPEGFPPHSRQSTPAAPPSLHPSPAYSAGPSTTRRRSPQNEKMVYDPASFYSSPVSAHLSSPPRQPRRMASSASLQSSGVVSPYPPRALPPGIGPPR